MIDALARVTYLPGSADKRFARDMAARKAINPDYEMSERQRAYLRRLVHRYRRQIGVRQASVLIDKHDEEQIHAE